MSLFFSSFCFDILIVSLLPFAFSFRNTQEFGRECLDICLIFILLHPSVWSRDAFETSSERL